MNWKVEGASVGRRGSARQRKPPVRLQEYCCRVSTCKQGLQMYPAADGSVDVQPIVVSGPSSVRCSSVVVVDAARSMSPNAISEDFPPVAVASASSANAARIAAPTASCYAVAVVADGTPVVTVSGASSARVSSAVVLIAACPSVVAACSMSLDDIADDGSADILSFGVCCTRAATGCVVHMVTDDVPVAVAPGAPSACYELLVEDISDDDPVPMILALRCQPRFLQMSSPLKRPVLRRSVTFQMTSTTVMLPRPVCRCVICIVFFSCR